jgi:hypothetical protein
MFGGMVFSTKLTVVVIPVICPLVKRREGTSSRLKPRHTPSSTSGQRLKGNT